MPWRSLLCLVVVLGACAGATDAAPSGTNGTDDRDAAVVDVATVLSPDDVDPARLAPLEGLGPCSERPATEDLAVDVPLPPTTVVVTVQEVGELTQVQGYVERTPVEAMVALLAVEGWSTVQAEDEVFESEVLLTDGTRRLYVKTQAVCERGSALVAFSGVNAPVPTPTGG